MAYKLFYTHSAEKDLSRIDQKQAAKILMKVDEYLKLPNPLLKAKKLKGFEADTYRFRVGDYRVVFRLDEKTGEFVVVVILKISHRKDVYKEI